LIPLVILSALLLGALIYTIRASAKERVSYIKMTELVISEGRKERQELANRIQRPEATPLYDPHEEPQAITYDSDDEFWAYKEDAN
jgi:hypothetical protein